MLSKSYKPNRVFSLHRYFMWAILMKQDFEKALRKGDYLPQADEPVAIYPVKFMALSVGTYMSYWYSALYVVCEGWAELGLSDPEVDSLLQSPNLELLKRYRNGSFHFQAEYFDDRFCDFQGEQGTVPWVRDLTDAFDRWFMANIKLQEPKML